MCNPLRSFYRAGGKLWVGGLLAFEYRICDRRTSLLCVQLHDICQSNRRSTTEIYLEITHDPLLFSVAQGIF